MTRTYEHIRTDTEAIAYIEKYTAPVYAERTGSIIGYDLEEAEYLYLIHMAKKAERLREALEYISRNEGRILCGSVAREALREASH